MLKNDLSNKTAPMLLFNFEHIICEELHTGWRFKYTVNRQSINAINNLYRMDYHILYLTFVVPERKLDKLEDELEEFGCLFGGMMKVGDSDSLRFFLSQTGATYFDTDKNLVDKVSPHGMLWQDHFVSIWNRGR